MTDCGGTRKIMYLRPNEIPPDAVWRDGGFDCPGCPDCRPQKGSGLNMEKVWYRQENARLRELLREPTRCNVAHVYDSSGRPLINFVGVPAEWLRDIRRELDRKEGANVATEPEGRILSHREWASTLKTARDFHSTTVEERTDALVMLKADREALRAERDEWQEDYFNMRDRAEKAEAALRKIGTRDVEFLRATGEIAERREGGDDG